MKKVILSLMAVMMISATASAMSYSQAREQALFLTDKMAYELNLNDQQYEAAYEINLDYLMGINDYSDLYGVYWTRRNLDLSYILLDWQYRAYCAANYFYRPLYWQRGYWHFAVYARYPHRDYFYFGRPHFVAVYRGGHSWHRNGNRSWYHGRDFGRREPRHATRGNGMRDRFDRGEFGKGTRDFGGRDRQPRNSAVVRTDNGSRSFGGRAVQQAGNSGTRDNAGGRANGIDRVVERDNRTSGSPSGAFGNGSGRLGSGSLNRTDDNRRDNSLGSVVNRGSNRSIGGSLNRTDDNRRGNSLGGAVNRGTSGSVSGNGNFGSRLNGGLRSSTRTTVERRGGESRPSMDSRSVGTPSRTFNPRSDSPSRGSGSFSSGSRFGGGSMGGSRSAGGHSGGSRSGGGSFGGGHR